MTNIDQTLQQLSGTGNPQGQSGQSAQPSQPQQGIVPALSATSVQNQQEAQNVGGGDATDLLSKFAGSDFSDMKKIVKFVQEGHKLDNAAMQELLYRLKTKHNMTYRELLSVYLTMDMAVEKGVLTNDIIDYLKKNPEMIQKF